MKVYHKSWKQLLNDCLLVAFTFGTIGIALKFTTYLNQWVYFPAFPNMLDSAFLITAILYFAWAARKRIHKKEIYSIPKISMQANLELEEPNTIEEISEY